MKWRWVDKERSAERNGELRKENFCLPAERQGEEHSALVLSSRLLDFLVACGLERRRRRREEELARRKERLRRREKVRRVIKEEVGRRGRERRRGTGRREVPLSAGG